MVCEVPAHDALDAGVLHLHGDVVAVVRARAVDLRQRGRRDGVGVELGEERLDRAAELALDDADASPATGRGGTASWSIESVSTYSSMRMSARLPRNWQALMIRPCWRTARRTTARAALRWNWWVASAMRASP